MRAETLAVHAGREDCRAQGVHALPIDLSTTYPLHDLEAGSADLDRWVAGEASAQSPVYARLFNPTVGRFEEALARLEGADSAVAFSSGMAALTALLLARRDAGDHVLAVRPLYGTTDHLLNSELLGLRVRWVTANEIGDAVNPSTALVMIETPANPTLELIDIQQVVRAAGEVPVLVDSTFATPVLQNPLRLGARYVLHSASKFLGGHGDVIAGVVACAEADARQLRRVRVATGALLHPLGAYLLHRGLATLPIRVERAQRGAGWLAQKLNGHPAVARVLYPGLGACDPRGLIGRQQKGPGAVLALELHAGFAGAADCLKRLRLITPAVSLGSVDTLIQHPAGLTHRVVDAAAQSDAGITPGLLRLSVGLESPEDLWADLSAALRRGNEVGPGLPSGSRPEALRPACDSARV